MKVIEKSVAKDEYTEKFKMELEEDVETCWKSMYKVAKAERQPSRAWYHNPDGFCRKLYMSMFIWSTNCVLESNICHSKPRK